MMLPDAPWQNWPGMKHLLDTLDAKGGATRYVGGCVRDTLLEVPVSDVDLATRIEPEEVLARLDKARIKAVPTGIAHGTVTAVIAGRPIEITTLRRDVSTDGRRATVAFTDDWCEDAARRDFTINALFADPIYHGLFDYFGGLDDLKEGRVRFIGNPRERIAEDHLRILRFFRFHARFGRGEADSAAVEACAERANDLMALSRERIADELTKLLALPEPVGAVQLMVGRGILRPVLPEIETAGVEQLARLVRIERELGLSADPYRRMAALFPPDPEAAAAIAARLRLSNRARKRLAAAAERGHEAIGDPRLLAYRIGAEEAADRLLLSTDTRHLQEKLALLDGWRKPRLPVSGGDLIAMGLKPGPDVSRILQAVEQEWAEGGFSGDRAAVEQVARRHVDQLLRASQ
ncbi:MAG: CCA tRNA nucleotidyltransferase [Sphingomonadales bacterium]